MRAIHRALTTLIVAGLLTAGAATAAASSDASSGFGAYHGDGYANQSWLAVQNATRQAETWARFGGYDPFFDCNVVFSSATETSPGYFHGRVTLHCWN